MTPKRPPNKPHCLQTGGNDVVPDGWNLARTFQRALFIKSPTLFITVEKNLVWMLISSLAVLGQATLPEFVLGNMVNSMELTT